MKMLSSSSGYKSELSEKNVVYREERTGAVNEPIEGLQREMMRSKYIRRI
jgi:hypothetical protein